MGVLVVLKFRFAKVVALAVSIGNNLRPIIAKIFGPALAFIIPKEYHHVSCRIHAAPKAISPREIGIFFFGAETTPPYVEQAVATHVSRYVVPVHEPCSRWHIHRLS